MKRIAIWTVLLGLVALSFSSYAACDSEEHGQYPKENLERASETTDRRQHLRDLYDTTLKKARKLKSSGKCDKAIALFKKAIEELEDSDYDIFPGKPGSFYSALGGFASECGDVEEGIGAYQKAIEIFEESSHLYLAADHSWLLGQIYERTGDLENAERYYLSSIEFDGKLQLEDDLEGCVEYRTVHAMIALHRLYKKKGKIAKADELAVKMAGLQGCRHSANKMLKDFNSEKNSGVTH